MARLQVLFGNVADAPAETPAETRTQDKCRGAYVVPVPACWVFIRFILLITVGICPALFCVPK